MHIHTHYKYLSQEQVANVDQCVQCQEHGGGLIRKRGQKGIHLLLAVSKLCGDGSHERFSNASGCNYHYIHENCTKT